MPATYAEKNRPKIKTAPSEITQSSVSAPLLALLLSSYLLELQIPREPFNFSNFAVLLASLVAIYIAIKRRKFLRRSTTIYRPAILSLVVFGLYAFSTTIWSISKPDTIFQSSLLIAIFLACAAVDEIRPSIVAQIIVYSAAIFAFLSFVSILINPSFAFQPSSSTQGEELRGIFFHQQRNGLFMVIAAGLFGILTANRDWNTTTGRPSVKHYIWLTLIIACLVASVARSYSLFLLVALGGTLLLGRRGQLRFLGIIALTIVAAAIALSIDYAPSLLAESDVDLTLTGRTMVWSRSLAVADQRWLLGWGYGTYFSDYFNYIWGNYRPPHAHNTFLNVYFEAGVVGLILIVFSIIVQVWSSATNADKMRKHSYALYLVILTTLCGITGTFYGGKLSFLLIAVVLFVCAENNYTRKLRYSQNNMVEQTQGIGKI